MIEQLLEIDEERILKLPVKAQKLACEIKNLVMERDNLIEENDSLKNKIKELEQTIENDYELKKIDPYDEYGVSEKDFY